MDDLENGTFMVFACSEAAIHMALHDGYNVLFFALLVLPPFHVQLNTELMQRGQRGDQATEKSDAGWIGGSSWDVERAPPKLGRVGCDTIR